MSNQNGKDGADERVIDEISTEGKQALEELKADLEKYTNQLETELLREKEKYDSGLKMGSDKDGQGE